MFTMPLVEWAVILVIVLLLSAGLVLYMKSNKKPNPMLQLILIVVLLSLGIAGVKFGGEALGIVPAGTSAAGGNAYRQALMLLQEPYILYTSSNNLASTNRESLTERFEKMEALELSELKDRVRSLKAMIAGAPATGQTGIYNMRMTSDIQARWEELRQELQKRAER